jgi:hypothetical protein
LLDFLRGFSIALSERVGEPLGKILAFQNLP